jgi:hypothetical protein
MSNTYDPHAIETYWQDHWETSRRHTTDLNHAQRPFYNLMEFPYPSGEGLHIGHVFSFGGADTYGRFQRRRGYQVFQPMGFDAFGIHSENYALRIGEHPFTLTRRTTARFRQQLQRLGGAFDWDRVIDKYTPRASIGTIVCKYGRTTGSTCGKVEQNYYNYQNSPTWLLIKSLSTSVKVTCEGDSGSPWYNGTTAIAMHTAGWCDLNNNKAIAMPVIGFLDRGYTPVTTP